MSFTSLETEVVLSIVFLRVSLCMIVFMEMIVMLTEGYKKNIALVDAIKY